MTKVTNQFPMPLMSYSDPGGRGRGGGGKRGGSTAIKRICALAAWHIWHTCWQGKPNSGQLAAALAEVAVLERCSKRVLLDMLGLIMAAGRGACGGKQERLADCLAYGGMLAKAFTTRSFEWTLEKFSQQPAAVGKQVLSPWFGAAGKEWRFSVYPAGCKEGHSSGECFSHCFAFQLAQDLRLHQGFYKLPRSFSFRAAVFLACKQPCTTIFFSIEVVDQAAVASQNKLMPFCGILQVGPQGRGWPKFMPIAELHTRGYLAGDRLQLRARVEVVP